MKLAPPPRGRLALWSGAGLILFFGFLASYDYYALNNAPAEYVANDALLAELNAASLPGEPARVDASPGDWAQWRGPRRDAVSAETGVLAAWPEAGLPVLWRIPCGEGYSCLAVVGNRLFTQCRENGEEVAVCWDADTGKPVWRFAYAAPAEIPYGSGPRATPTVDGDHIYVLGATGILHCLRSATGERVWRRDLLQEFGAKNPTWGTSCSPLVEGNLVLVSPGGPNGNSIVALDKLTGAKVWSALDDSPSYSSPLAITAAGVRQVVFFTGDAVVGLAPADGKLYWRYPWPTHEHINCATPIALDDYLFVSSGYNAGSALLKVLRAGDGLRVERVYQTKAMANHFASCVLYREHLFGCSESGLLTCIKFRTGEVMWKQRGYNKGSLMAVDGHLIVLAENGGKMALVEATPEGYREKRKTAVPEERCWTMPVLAHGRIYLRTQKEAICFDLGGKASESTTKDTKDTKKHE
jgi:outer membrane protein assembly factor BamB